MENIQPACFTSGLMRKVTCFRNQESFSGRLIGQIGYALAAVAAIVETLASLAIMAVTATLFLSLLTIDWGLKEVGLPSNCLTHSAEKIGLITWFSARNLRSSLFCIPWAIVDFALNPFLTPLVADEKSARVLWESGNLVAIPPGAIL